MFPEIIRLQFGPLAQKPAFLTIFALFLAALAMRGALLPAAYAAQPVIDRVQVEPTAREIGIRIRFNRLLRYVTHTPKSSGEILVINLRPVQSSADYAEAFLIRETANPVGSRAGVIDEIRYEGDHPTGPKLIIEFTRRVTFRVQGAADLRGIEVFVAQAERRRTEQPALPVAPTDQSPPASAPAPEVPSGDYVLNLSSGRKPFTARSMPRSEVFSKFQLYSYPFQKNGRTWYRLRLGFFATKKQAQEAIRTLPRQFARAWIAKIDAEERRNWARYALLDASRRQPAAPAIAADRGMSSKQTARPPSPPPQPAVPEQRLTQIWDEAKDAMTRSDYRRAIQLYTKLTQLPAHEYSQQAREFLGLARERNGQMAHAKAEYETYLSLYPKGEGADRVRQRLAGVLTARAEPKSKLREAKRSAEKKEWEVQNYGGISQFYTYRESVTDSAGRVTTQSDLANDLDFTTRLTSDRFDLRGVFVGSHVFNFADQADTNESRVSSLYFDMVDRTSGLSSRIGRQTRNSGGVLGRFDGGYIGYQVIPEIKLNGVVGRPVESTNSAEFDTRRYFYGISTDIGPFDKAWNFNLFAINQEVDGINERRAVGGETRYLRDGISAFTLVDYDITFDDLNIALFNGTATFPSQTTVNLSAEYRKSPVLLASNALQGQTAETVAVLLNTLSADEVRDLAKDRTADSHSVTLGAAQPLNEHYQISADVTTTRLSDTKASGGVPANEGTNYEWFYSAQFTGTNLIKEGDVSIIGLRFADTKTSKTATVDLNMRYPIDQKWRINPRLRTDYRLKTGDQGSRFRIRPTVRINYRWKRPVNIELEAGGEWSTERIFDDAAVGTGTAEDTAEWFARLGYRYDY